MSRALFWLAAVLFLCLAAATPTKNSPFRARADAGAGNTAPGGGERRRSVDKGHGVAPPRRRQAGGLLDGILLWPPAGRDDGETCDEAAGASANAALGAGNAHLTANRWSAALACYRRALDADPGHVVVAANAGLALVSSGATAAGSRACSAALAARPGYDQALYCLGAAAMAESRYFDARTYLKGAANAPAAPAAHAAHFRELWGTATAAHSRHLLSQGRLQMALDAADEAISAWPGCAPAHMARGFALRHLGRHGDAESSLSSAVALAPSDPESHANLALLHQHLGRVDDAAAGLRAALALAPSFVAAHVALGRLHAVHAPQLALASFAAALDVEPGHAEARVGLAAARAAACAWHPGEDDALRHAILADAATQSAAAPTGGRPALPPYDAVLHCRLPPSRLKRLTAAYAAVAAQDASRLQLPPFPRPSPPRRGVSALRVAYLSSDYGEQPVGRLIPPLFEGHNARGRVAGRPIALTAPDGSIARSRVDAAAAPHGGTLAGGRFSHGALAGAIAGWGAHILVDLMGYTAGSWALTREVVVALRPAAITVAWLGYPGPAGMDPWAEWASGRYAYTVADRACLPPDAAAAYFAEKIVWMPRAYQLNDARGAYPHRPGPPPTPDETGAARTAQGLPSSPDVFVYAHFNTLRKVEPTVFAAWMAILRRAPTSVLWMLRMPAAAEEPLRRAAIAAGVDARRLVFSPPAPAADHVTRCALADLFLDSLWYNAHTTATDALWAGVPLLTLPSRGMMQGRVAASLAVAAGAPSLIVSSLAEYVTLAVELRG